MFSTIFNFELKRWFKNPSFYIFLTLFFVLSLLLGAKNFGVFESVTSIGATNAYANSPSALQMHISGMNLFIYFLLPIIVGSSVYRDFRYNMHTVLFSYPFTKLNYIAGKFLSSFLITTLITLTILLGFEAARMFPSANQDLIAPFNVVAYLQIYLIYVIPNLFFVGVLIFGLVTITRNISIGFIGVIMIFVIQEVLFSFAKDIDNRYIVGLWEPFGFEASGYYTKYWTVAEQNENLLPFEGVIIYNRLIWLSISLVLLVFIYRYFSFTQTALTIKKSKRSDREVKNNFEGIVRIVMPKVAFNFSGWQNFKTMWHLSRIDFKFIVKNWAFIAITIVGLSYLLLRSINTGTMYTTKILPVTWQMLLIPGTSFMLFINILTFLFTGILIHRGAVSRMGHLIDVTPIPNWVLLLSKFIAVIKMQVILLLLILVAGALIHSYRGYYDFEIGHYLFELYGLQFIHCVIWALLAVLIQTLIKNYLIGFFVLMVLAIGFSFLPDIGIEQKIFAYNASPGFQYSDMNGYGSGLNSYYAHKLYWLLFGIVLLYVSLLFWNRGVPAPAKERFVAAKKRFTAAIAVPIVVAFIGFIAIGSWIYYENNIAEVRYSEKDTEKQAVEFEKKYKKFQNYPQPRITDINVAMDIYPESRDFKAKGYYYLKNKTTHTIDSLIIDNRENSEYKSNISFNRTAQLISKDTLHHFHIYLLKQPLAPGDSIQLNFVMYNKPNTLIRNNSPVLANGTFINGGIFPAIGYNELAELEDNAARKKYGLKPKELMANVNDTIARKNTDASTYADWITFETTVSISGDQIAIAPGYL